MLVVLLNSGEYASLTSIYVYIFYSPHAFLAIIYYVWLSVHIHQWIFCQRQGDRYEILGKYITIA